MDWEDILRLLICLGRYRKLVPEQVDTDLQINNERQNFIPIRDSCLGTNTFGPTFLLGVGRVTGQAFGCGNLFENKRSIISAAFRYSFAVSPDDVLSEETYQFRIQVNVAGRMEHFPSVTPGGLPVFTRQPPPTTLGQVFTTIRVTQGTSQLAFMPQFFQYTREHTPDGTILDDPILRTDIVSVDFTPWSNSPIFIEVVVSVQAAATGEFSDIKVGGIDSIDSQSLEVRAESPIVQKTPGDDVCWEILDSRVRTVRSR